MKFSNEELIQKLAKFRKETKEKEWLEFKEAKNGISFDDLGKYFSALSNEAQLQSVECGWLILGIEDKRNSLKLSLKDLDEEIKELKKTAKQAQSLPDKLAAQKRVKSLEKKRDEAWREYDATGRKIEEDKDRLIETIEQKLSAKETLVEVFTIRWKII